MEIVTLFVKDASGNNIATKNDFRLGPTPQFNVGIYGGQGLVEIARVDQRPDQTVLSAILVDGANA